MHRFRLSSWLLGFVAITGELTLGQDRDQAANQQKKRSLPPFTISKETTYLTEPRRPDGYIDYVRALNDRYSNGVTSENNAAVIYLRAAGWGELAEEHRGQYLALLGIQTFAPSGEFFVSFQDYLAQNPATALLAPEVRERLLHQRRTAMEHPWSPSDQPMVAAWLTKNDRALGLAIEGTHRSRYFVPLVPDGIEGNVVASLLPQVQQLGEIARALTCRGMLRLNQGDVEGACRDAMACHRLSRHAGRGPMMLQRLVGFAIADFAAKATVQLAHSGKLTRDKLAEIQKTLRELPVVPDVSQAFDEGERFMFLDIVGLLTRDVEAGINALSLEEAMEKGKVLFRHAAINWDKVLTVGNQWYDQVAAAGRLPSYQQRLAAFERINKEHMKRESLASGDALVKSKSNRPEREWITETVGNILLVQLQTTFDLVRGGEDRCRMNLELTILSLGLAVYHQDHGIYPKSLSELKPQYVTAIPLDLFSNNEFVYKSTGKGYLLYSVGENGQDNDGQSFNDQPRGDDLTVRMVPGVQN